MAVRRANAAVNPRRATRHSGERKCDPIGAGISGYPGSYAAKAGEFCGCKCVVGHPRTLSRLMRTAAR
jgi:hypothetical protein